MRVGSHCPREREALAKARGKGRHGGVPRTLGVISSTHERVGFRNSNAKVLLPATGVERRCFG